MRRFLHDCMQHTIMALYGFQNSSTQPSQVPHAALGVHTAGVTTWEATPNADGFGVETYSHCHGQRTDSAEPELDAFSAIQ